jgi:hypothetical protein
MEAATLPLAVWESFYVIVGSSAAALTGLQFVVMALIAEGRGRKATTREIDAFGTPTIVHFCGALLVSAILSAPWHHVSNSAIALGCCGVAGIVYTAIVMRRARRQTGYKPVLEDWIWHSILPFVAYTALLVASLALQRYEAPALFAIGAITLLVLFIGIHNAWDSVVYITVEVLPQSRSADQKGQGQ